MAVIEQALGVLAERFGIDVQAADQILREVARQERTPIQELAECVVASTTNNCAVLPRTLYALDAA